MAPLLFLKALRGCCLPYCCLCRTLTHCLSVPSETPSVLFPTVLQLGVCKLHFPDLLARWLLVVFCKWDSVGTREVGEELSISIPISAGCHRPPVSRQPWLWSLLAQRTLVSWCRPRSFCDSPSVAPSLFLWVPVTWPSICSFSFRVDHCSTQEPISGFCFPLLPFQPSNTCVSKTLCHISSF